MLSRRPCNRRSGSPICRQCGPLLDPIVEEAIVEESKNEETLVKRIDSDSDSEISEDWVIISPQSEQEEEILEIEKDCSIVEADPTPFSNEVKSTEAGSQVFSAKPTKTKEKKKKEQAESQEAIGKDSEPGSIPDITSISQLGEAQASDPELVLIRA